MGDIFNLYNNKTGKYTFPADRHEDYVKLAVQNAIDKLNALKGLALKIDLCRYHRDRDTMGYAEVVFHDMKYEQELRLYYGQQLGDNYDDYLNMFVNDQLFEDNMSFDDFKDGIADMDSDTRVIARLAKAIWDGWKEWAERHDRSKLVAPTNAQAMSDLYNKAMQSIMDQMVIAKPITPDPNFTVQIDQNKVNEIWEKQMKDNLSGSLIFGKDVWVNDKGKVIVNIDGKDVEVD